MRRLLGAGALVALVALVLLVPIATSSAGAKAKPTTTTAATTTTTTAPRVPSLGVPHVEELDVVIVPGDFAELRCDPGEVALSASVAVVDNNTGTPQAINPRAGWMPLYEPPESKNPVGYRFAFENNFATGHPRLYVTCAPLTT
jgi:hypothetical protein